jgi:hypothetical protein
MSGPEELSLLPEIGTPAPCQTRLGTPSLRAGILSKALRIAVIAVPLGLAARAGDPLSPPSPLILDVRIERPKILSPPQPTARSVLATRPGLKPPPSPLAITVTVGHPDLPPPPKPHLRSVTLVRPR